MTDSPFKQYRRKQIAELRPYILGENLDEVSVSKEDVPKVGDMIARNPKNHADQWLVAKAYAADNFEEHEAQPDDGLKLETQAEVDLWSRVIGSVVRIPTADELESEWSAEWWACYREAMAICADSMVEKLRNRMPEKGISADVAGFNAAASDVFRKQCAEILERFRRTDIE